ncbi:serum amyloid A-4 protein-like [Carlito syrichta]|uniref:Serum amyloid A protein n=1 Tax=Carlito syrichta TaxID=1868482 RepID=A0A1U7TLV6_CARSF|nr:serum amyloid A-4 protein-like [Carlito syrichta]
MRLFTSIVFCSLVIGVSSEGWYSFFKEAAQGAWDLWRANWHMLEANYRNSNRYFHARGNYDAAQRGPGGIWAAKVLSNTRQYLQGLLSHYYFGSSSSVLDDLELNRKAEEWGRSGKDPNHFRPDGLPEGY